MKKLILIIALAFALGGCDECGGPACGDGLGGPDNGTTDCSTQGFGPDAGGDYDDE